MLKWILIIILTDGITTNTVVEGHYKQMDDCFASIEDVRQMLGRPMINYQAVCVRYTQSKPIPQKMINNINEE